MIVFKTITISGFGSIVEPLTYELDSPGLNMIQGRNGSGKTTIFSAFTWCLYGQTLKSKCEITPWQHIVPLARGQEFEGTKVEVTFKVGLEDCKVIRCNEYLPKLEGSKGKNRILLYINGVYQEELRDKRDVQAKIEKIMGMSFNLFKNSLVFGQKLTRLLSESGDAQKKLFDEAFEASFINVAREKAKKDRSFIQQDYDNIKGEYDIAKNNLSIWLKAIRSAKSVWKEEHDKRLSDLEESLAQKVQYGALLDEDRPNWLQLQKDEETLRNEIVALENRLQKLPALEKKHFKVDFNLGNLKAEITGLKAKGIELSKRLSSKVRECPVCGGIINEAKHKELEEQAKQELKLTLVRINRKRKKVKEMTARLERLTSSLSKYTKRRKRLSEKNRQLAELLEVGYDQVEFRPELYDKTMREVDAIEDQIAEEGKNTPNLKELRANKNTAKEKIAELKPEYKKLHKQIRLFDWLIDDPLSNKGLKAYIFNSMLGNVNDQLKLYSKYIGFTVVLGIDLDSGRKDFEAIIYQKKRPISYNDLSGGQQQLVDICLAFSIHDVISGYNPINILLMDEIFESLDQDNIELITEILYLKSKDISTHIISHQQGLNSAKLSNILQLEARSGMTCLA